MINSATELFLKLKKLGLDNCLTDPWWWPNSGTFSVIIGAILTQNSSWQNVEKSFKNLKEYNLCTLEALANSNNATLEELIRPSGFYRVKAKNLITLSKNILEEFSGFANFQEYVTREWLLKQRGIGQESSDAILNYACCKEAFVVDSYTNRLLRAFGYEFSSYEELQEWIVDNFSLNYELVFPNISLAQAYAKAHGMVVEYCKVNKKGRAIDIAPLQGA